MTLTTEDLAAISQLLDTKLKFELRPLKDDVSQLKGDVNQLKGDVSQLKGDVSQLKGDVNQLKDDVNQLKGDVNQLKDDVEQLKENQQATHNLLLETRLHIENTTDHNIQLLAENHINLVNKLNEAIPAVNQNLAYEVKVNYLLDKMNVIEKDVAEIKSKIA